MAAIASPEGKDGKCEDDEYDKGDYGGDEESLLASISS